MEVCLSSSNKDSVHHLWVLNTGQHLASYKNNFSSSPQVWTPFPDGRGMLCAQTHRAAIHCWFWNKEQPCLRFNIPEKLGALSLSNNGLYCIGGGISGKMYLWEVKTGRLYRIWSGHFRKITGLVWISDSLILSVSEDARLSLWDLTLIFTSEYDTEITALQTWTEHSLPITDIHCGGGGINARIFTTSRDQTCRVWDITLRKQIAVLKFPRGLSTVVIDQMESILCVGTLDGYIFFVDLLESNGSNIESTFSMDGEMLEEIPRVIKAHDGEITCLSISIDGTNVISSSVDGTVKVWDTFSRQMVRKFTRHKSEVTNCQIFTCPPGVNSQKEEVSSYGKAKRKKNETPIIPFNTFVYRPSTTTTSTSTKDITLDSVPIDIPLCSLSQSSELFLHDRKRIRGMGIEVTKREKAQQTYTETILSNLVTGGTDLDPRVENQKLRERIVAIESENKQWKRVTNKMYTNCVESVISKMMSKESNTQEQQEQSENVETTSEGSEE